MMRTMRSHAKWVFFILATAFIGWLAYGQVMEILGPGTNVVLRVNGRKVSIRFTPIPPVELEHIGDGRLTACILHTSRGLRI